MAIDEKLLKSIIAEVLKDMNAAEAPAPKASSAADIELVETGDAAKGTNPNEVVLGVAPAFGVSQTTNILGIPHGQIVKEIMAGIEEEIGRAHV